MNRNVFHKISMLLLVVMLGWVLLFSSGCSHMNRVDVGEIHPPLTVVVQMHPVYPMIAKQSGRTAQPGVEGWVRVGFLVTSTGDVEKISILDAQPRNIFDRVVVQAVKTWRFIPHTVEGHPVDAWAETVIRFRFEEEVGLAHPSLSVK